MARLSGIRALFSLRAVEDQLQEKVNNAENKMLQGLQYEGELFLNKARQTGNYTDRTGNLRASIGYVILKDGKQVFSAFPGGKEDGVSKAVQTANEVSGQFPKGYVLIGVAGMNYAAAVESLGYDVITGSAPRDKDIKDLLGAIKL